MPLRYGHNCSARPVKRKEVCSCADVKRMDKKVHHKEEKGLFGGMDVASMLPLLGAMQSGGDMTTVLKHMLKGKKMGGVDIGAMLPLILNSGLFAKKTETVKGSDVNRVIDLSEYRRVDQ